jgi:signal transduction histidine kinase
VALIASLFMYIRHYLQVNDSLRVFIEKNKIAESQLLQSETWVNILFISILVAIILAGTIIIFVYYQKVIQLYRMQQNFINGFTHELKTPIASMRLFLDTFRKHELSREEQLKYLDFMIRDTDRLADNVNQILNLGKIEDKNYSLNLIEYDFYTFVDEFLSKNPHLFEECEVSIKKIDHVQYMTKFDSALMEMVLMNILTNAIRYNDSKSPRVDISFSSLGKKMSIAFKDNGMGIDKSNHRNIFKKFYQVGKTTKGSGLGLYLTSQILRLHKATIEVDSSGNGLGSTFTVCLIRE